MRQFTVKFTAGPYEPSPETCLSWCYGASHLPCSQEWQPGAEAADSGKHSGGDAFLRFSIPAMHPSVPAPGSGVSSHLPTTTTDHYSHHGCPLLLVLLSASTVWQTLRTLEVLRPRTPDETHRPQGGPFAFVTRSWIP